MSEDNIEPFSKEFLVDPSTNRFTFHEDLNTVLNSTDTEQILLSYRRNLDYIYENSSDSTSWEKKYEKKRDIDLRLEYLRVLTKAIFSDFNNEKAGRSLYMRIIEEAVKKGVCSGEPSEDGFALFTTQVRKTVADLGHYGVDREEDHSKFGYSTFRDFLDALIECFSVGPRWNLTETGSFAKAEAMLERTENYAALESSEKSDDADDGCLFTYS